jgi:hypothetical protein
MTTRKKTASSPAKSNLDAAAEQRSDSAKAVGIDVSPGDIAEARKDGAIEAEKEAGKDSYRYATDGNLLPEEKVYGLLALERNGQNRTPYVQAAMKRLGLKASELPGGGPGYTNDVHPLSELKDHA